MGMTALGVPTMHALSRVTTMKPSTPFGILRVLLLFPCAAPCPANILMNGDFETPIAGSPDSGGSHYPGPVDNFRGGSTIPGWVIGGDSIDLVSSTYWTPASGNQSVDMNGLGPGYIYQDIHTVPGSSYSLRFAMSGNGNSTISHTTVLAVLWNGLLADLLTFDTSAQHGTDFLWEYHQYTLLADRPITRLLFQSYSPRIPEGSWPACCGAALDDVSLVGEGTPVWPPTEPLPRYLPFLIHPNPPPTTVPEHLATTFVVPPLLAVLAWSRVRRSSRSDRPALLATGIGGMNQA